MLSLRSHGAVRLTLALLLAIVGAARPAAAADAAAGSDALLRATPLFLKDGKMARVSVHTVPFGQSAASLGAEAGQKLAALTGAIATDCFLTAQVIGHVDAEEAKDVKAHRLARARADAVQAALIGGGLQAASIASVWDWQFMLQDARATIWVFRLVPGEDCADRPLGADGQDLVAQGDGARSAADAVIADAVVAGAPARPAEHPIATIADALLPPDEAPGAERADAASAGTPADPAMPAVRAALDQAPPVDRAAATQEPGVPAALAPTPAPRAREGAAAPVLATAAPARTPPATLPPAAIEPGNSVVRPLPEAPPLPALAAARRPAGTQAAPAPAQPQLAAAPAERSAAAGAPAGADRLAIVFPTNSSYFPPGTRDALQRLVDGLDRAGRYRVSLIASVGSASHVAGAGSAQEAMRYNEWLAERRLERVRSWLEEYRAQPGLTFETELRQSDDRQVLVRIAPAG
jgi:outer membrane protein OmpA-like peptidoglycan-associated protein